MLEFLEEKGIGEKGVQYKMKDWAFNRQRYWGEPIPSSIAPLRRCSGPYEELPLRLPRSRTTSPAPTESPRSPRSPSS